MPLLEVELVILPNETPRATLAAEIADAAATVFGSPAGRVWVRLRFLAREYYAENGGPLPDDLSPAFVTVLHARSPLGDEREAEAARLTGALARACGRAAESVHLFYQPDGAGRVFFGGRPAG